MMQSKDSIHIVSFSIPYPANYGGVIDVFHKLRLLHEAGVVVHLHCFQYDRNPSNVLDQFCKTVNYYPRKGGLKALFNSTPYIVASRVSDELICNLEKDPLPILYEGLHCLGNIPGNNRRLLYRESNIEHDYYRALAKSDRSIWKGIYYRSEAKKLEAYESRIALCQNILAVNETDANYFKGKFPLSETSYIPSFHANDTVNILEGKGNYVLLHGNWLVEENRVYLFYFLKHIAKEIPAPIKIAGRFIPENLRQQFAHYKNIQWINNPDEPTMKALLQQAQVHFLYTDQATGLKLKLLNVLHLGRHVVVNSKMLAGTNLQAACVVADTVEEQIQKINSMLSVEFTSKDCEKRIAQLSNFNNHTNLQKLIKLL
jgi:hypothetical protein